VVASPLRYLRQNNPGKANNKERSHFATEESSSRFTLHASRFTLHGFTLHASRFTLHAYDSDEKPKDANATHPANFFHL